MLLIDKSNLMEKIDLEGEYKIAGVDNEYRVDGLTMGRRQSIIPSYLGKSAV